MGVRPREICSDIWRVFGWRSTEGSGNDGTSGSKRMVGAASIGAEVVLTLGDISLLLVMFCLMGSLGNGGLNLCGWGLEGGARNVIEF